MVLSTSLLLILPLLLSIFPILVISSDYTTLVFKGCADRNFPDSNGGSNVYKQSRKSLLNILTSQSSSSKFYKTTTSSTINGLFQCRGDLSNNDCNRCIKRSAFISHSLCGESLAVRVHLTGCYLKYEIAGFRQTNGTELIYKLCGSTQARLDGFSNRLETALSEIVKGVENGNGFYAGGYQSVFVLGQCEGDLESTDCSNCVKSAIDGAGSECGSSLSAQVYLEKCYISYTYYPNGVPGDGKAVSSSTGGGGGGRRTEKTVAIVLGGVVGVGMLAACLLFTKSIFKKKTHTYKYGG